MTFEALVETNDTFLAAAPGSEAVEFREVADGSTGAWREVRAFVLEGNEDQEGVIDAPRGSRGPLPIRVVLFKAEVPEIRWGKDEIRRRGAVYKLTTPLQEGSSWWEAYCKR